MCISILPNIEVQYAIPHRLLKAISKTESGRYRRGILAPWPWTINVRGKGYFFENKEDGILAVKTLLKSGITSIDIGCMQVNFHHHGKNFSSIEDMFDPYKNISYAAKFLRDLKKAHGSWEKAVGHYHSGVPSHQISNKEKVMKHMASDEKSSYNGSFQNDTPATPQGFPQSKGASIFAQSQGNWRQGAAAFNTRMYLAKFRQPLLINSQPLFMNPKRGDGADGHK
jgi:hypothetical protein